MPDYLFDPTVERKAAAERLRNAGQFQMGMEIDGRRKQGSRREIRSAVGLANLADAAAFGPHKSIADRFTADRKKPSG